MALDRLEHLFSVDSLAFGKAVTLGSNPSKQGHNPIKSITFNLLYDGI